MRQEERDVYIIPPNFIEGGTLLGGMFKTRNVIEAGILGALTGIPVLKLPFSLTARIIVLCLTTLPLVLVSSASAAAACPNLSSSFSASSATEGRWIGMVRGFGKRACIPAGAIAPRQRTKAKRPRAGTAWRWI